MKRIKMFFLNAQVYLIVFFVSLIIYQFLYSNIERYDGIKHIVLGLAYTFLALSLIEFRERFNERKKYGQLSGIYIRKEINQTIHDKTTGIKYQSLDYSKVDNKIEINYQDGLMYEIKLKYKEGSVVGYIFLDPVNQNIGKGNYQYIDKIDKLTLPDFGSYFLLVDIINNNVLHIQYKNYLPSGNAAGWEKWERID
jgi:hypothetical protein